MISAARIPSNTPKAKLLSGVPMIPPACDLSGRPAAAHGRFRRRHLPL